MLGNILFVSISPNQMQLQIWGANEYCGALISQRILNEGPDGQVDAILLKWNPRLNELETFTDDCCHHIHFGVMLV